MRFISGHNVHNNGADYVVNDAGCWVWQKAKWDGYGSLWKDGRHVKAHREYYENAKGPIPPGLQIDHLCRNPSCVNPDHLEAVSAMENVRRGVHTKLTADEVREIKRIGRRESLRAVGSKFGVDLSTVCDILRGKTWVNITP